MNDLPRAASEDRTADSEASLQISSIPQCCCGKSECAFLAHSNSLLEALELDVKTAAQLGQALLIRHESYVSEAQAERARMTSNIEKLEHDKRDLEAKNASIIEENRALLDQLECLNNAVVESDAQVESLSATLSSTQVELQRLRILAARTESLEALLLQLEREQGELQDTLATTAQEEKSAVQRWRRAERAIADLHDQVDRIEREAKEERERHVEVVGRMERRRAVERELETAAGRLKGAAAAKTAGRDKNGSSVVSHFVKDILQDNANLQLGVVELREMLLNSNEEVERLREQLMLHAPLDEGPEGMRTPTLQAELGVDQMPKEELHIHHHYHAPELAPRPRPALQRRFKKRRNVLTPGHFTPPISHTPRSSISAGVPTTSSSTAAILSQSSVTIPNRASQRWSLQSSQTGASIAPSSVPSSPYSTSYRASSMFDRVFSEADLESSRPTSPESNGEQSPMMHPMYAKETPPGPMRSISTPATFLNQTQSSAQAALNAISQGLPSRSEYTHARKISDLDLQATDPISDAIPEENEDLDLASPSPDLATPGSEIESAKATPICAQAPRLRRTASTSSLLSISGMDITTYSPDPRQTLRSRPSLLAASPSSSLASPSPVLSQTTVTARSVPRRGVDSRAMHQQLLAGRSVSGSARSPTTAGKATLGRKVGGWVWGRWGKTPAPAPAPPSTSLSNQSMTGRPTTPEAGKDTPQVSISQASSAPLRIPSPPRPIPGLKVGSATSSIVSPTASDYTSAQSSLALGAHSSFGASPANKTLRKVPKFRTPGVNQDGPILALLGVEEKKVLVKVEVMEGEVDEAALREALEE